MFSLTWSASLLIYWNKGKFLNKKRVQLPPDWFGTPTWRLFIVLEHQYRRRDVMWKRSIELGINLPERRHSRRVSRRLRFRAAASCVSLPARELVTAPFSSGWAGFTYFDTLSPFVESHTGIAYACKSKLVTYTSHIQFGGRNLGGGWWVVDWVVICYLYFSSVFYHSSRRKNPLLQLFITHVTFW